MLVSILSSMPLVLAATLQIHDSIPEDILSKSQQSNDALVIESGASEMNGDDILIIPFLRGEIYGAAKVEVNTTNTYAVKTVNRSGPFVVELLPKDGAQQIEYKLHVWSGRWTQARYERTSLQFTFKDVKPSGNLFKIFKKHFAIQQRRVL